MNYISHVNPRYFAAIAKFASNRDVRYYLNGVCITPHHEKGVVVVATNGHVLGAIHDPDGYVDCEIIVPMPPKAILSACLKQDKRNHPGAAHLWIGTDRILVSSEKNVAVPPEAFGDDVLAQAASKLIDGKFPDWRRIIPKPDEKSDGITPVVGTKVLQPFVEAAQILGSKTYGGRMRMEQRGSASSIIVRMDSDLFVGIAMPMRDDARPEGLPSFCTERPAPKLVAAAKPRARVLDGKLVPAASA